MLTRVFGTIGIASLGFGIFATIIEGPKPIYVFDIGMGVLLLCIAFIFSEDLRRLR
jgi:hypothetical protein